MFPGGAQALSTQVDLGTSSSWLWGTHKHKEIQITPAPGRCGSPSSHPPCLTVLGVESFTEALLLLP